MRTDWPPDRSPDDIEVLRQPINQRLIEAWVRLIVDLKILIT